MDGGDQYNFESEKTAKRLTDLTEDEPVSSPSSCDFPKSHLKTEIFFGETGKGFQPPNELYFANQENAQDLTQNEEEEPAIKKFRQPIEDKPIDENEDEIFISALPNDDENWLLQSVHSRPQGPDDARAVPQFQASSFGPPYAAMMEHEQFFWSQKFALRADWISISGVYRGHRRYAICEELDTTVSLLRNRSEESFNLSNISHELDILTESRKRKR